MKKKFLNVKSGTVVLAIQHLGMPPGPVIEPGMIGIVVAGASVRWLAGGTCPVFEDEVEVRV